MRRSLLAVFALALISSPVILADDKPTKDIVDTAVGAKSFGTLVTAVKAADLVDTLKGKGPFTVFAPTDEAFEKLTEKLGKEKFDGILKNKETLSKILLTHVVIGKEVMAADVVGMDGKEVNGYTVGVKGGKVTLTRGKDVINVVKTDIKCSNGVIHVIDGVMTPGKGGKGYGKGGN